MSMSRRTRSFLTTSAAALILSVAGAGLTAPANAAPASAASAGREARAAAFFNAGGVWTIFQTNATVRIDVRQDAAGNLFGTTSSGGTVGTLQEGAVTGNDIYFIVQWNHGPRGRYTGTRGADGRLSGLTVDLNNPSSQSSWRSDRTF
ncbi:hypothetical protein OG851_30680 [Streptomyces sp. NBC_00161]|uniref:hypothetical protein n=1 Tax=Streptomyces sp. NBC_00161 TaxID=2975671 RepID=UPI0032463FB0